MKYAVEGQELTDIADALRRKHGETEWITVTEQREYAGFVVSKSEGSTGFGSYGGGFKAGAIAQVIEIPQATSLKVNIEMKFPTGYSSVLIAKGIYNVDDFPRLVTENNYTNKNGEHIFDSVNTITIYYNDGYAASGNYGYYAEITGLDAEGNLVDTATMNVEVEKEVKNTYQSSEMAQAIDDILPAPPEEAFVISGDCSYRFAYGGWDWFVEEYGDKITMDNVTNAQYMFKSSGVESIPFEVKAIGSAGYCNVQNMFDGCNKLKSIKKLIIKPQRTIGGLFNNCYMLREIPEMEIDWSYALTQTNFNSSSMFYYCYSLRRLPSALMEALEDIDTNLSYAMPNGFTYLYALDEAINVPTFIDKELTSDVLYGYSNALSTCCRLKNLTFMCQEDGTPKVRRWKNQDIDLTKYVGYANNKTSILNYNSGITADKEVTDDASYQALKNDPDWFTCDIAYSRYNHDSAVATINSLPDTSAYLAEKGGTNTIKFKGAAGSKTDGGAINTLTEEEIAVATAKGWTVALS